jgi:DNA-binding response OmpR family regulator
MGRNANVRPVQILYIGRADPSYDRVWQGFQQEGIAVTFASTQTMGLQMARETKPNIIVVSTTNSHFSGVYLCRVLGRRLPGAQRIVITERGEGESIACEQRLVRPFTARKLRDTLRKMIEMTVPHKLTAGVVELDQVSRLVNGAVGRHHLTPKQADLLAIFMQRPNQVISRKELMEQIWKTGYLGDTRTLDVHIRWLREKIETDPDHPAVLITKRGIGYMLVAPAPDVSLEQSVDSEDLEPLED